MIREEDLENAIVALYEYFCLIIVIRVAMKIQNISDIYYYIKLWRERIYANNVGNGKLFLKITSYSYSLPGQNNYRY